VISKSTAAPEQRHGARPDTLGVTVQYVWSRRYIDAPVFRDRDADADSETGDLGVTDSGLDERLYYTTDANMNVTALLDTAGDAVERYIYDPYGSVTVYSDDWSTTVDWDDSKKNPVRYCGYYHDSETGLYHVRHRSYHPALGRWLQRDQSGYNGDINLFQYVTGSPTTRSDPMGLEPYDMVGWPRWEQCSGYDYEKLPMNEDHIRRPGGGPATTLGAALSFYKTRLRPLYGTGGSGTSVTGLPDEPQCEDGETRGEEVLIKTYYIDEEPFWARDWEGAKPPDAPRPTPAPDAPTSVDVPGSPVDVTFTVPGHPPSQPGTTVNKERQYYESIATVEKVRMHYCCENGMWKMDCRETLGPFSVYSDTVFYADVTVTTTVTH